MFQILKLKYLKVYTHTNKKEKLWTFFCNNTNNTELEHKAIFHFLKNFFIS